MADLQAAAEAAEAALAEKKETAVLFAAVTPPGWAVGTGERKGSRFLDPGREPFAPSGRLVKKYGRCSGEAAAAGALAVRERAGSGWGVYITAPALIPLPLSGDPEEDGSTDFSLIYIAVSDGRKAAVQQLELPGDLSGPAARAAAAEEAAGQALTLLAGLLKEDPDALALRRPAAALRKYAVPFWRRALRLLLPWKGDGTGLILLKAGLLAAMLLDLLSAGLYISCAGS